MDWSLIARCGVRYTLVAAVTTVAVGYLLVRTPTTLVALFGLGLLAVVVSLGGTDTVRASTVAANDDADGLQTGIVDPSDVQAKNLDSDIKLLFYGLGLCLFAVVSFSLFVL